MWWRWSISLCVLASCAGQRETPPKAEESAEGSAEQTNTTPAVPAPAKPAVTLSELARQVDAAAKANDTAWQAAREQGWKSAGADLKALKALYPKQELRFYQPDGNLTADGKAVMALLGELDRHGLDKSGYRLTQLDLATRKVPEAFVARKAAATAVAGDRAQAVAVAVLGWLGSGVGSEAALVQAGGDQLSESSLQALSTQVPGLAKAALEVRTALWTADVEIQRAVLRYLVDMLYGLPAHPQKYMAPAAIRKLSDTNAGELVAKLGAPGRAANAMKAAWPSHPQYARLLEAVDQYAKLVEAGGWQPMPAGAGDKGLKVGASGPVVTALRARLTAEGYDGGSGERFDAALGEALADFQSHHQLDGDGVLTKTTVFELDVPAEQRLKQLRLGLQRLRESEGRDPGTYYVWVNIALQKLWLIQDGEVVQEHRVVVGNNDTDVDQATHLKGKINRTKMFSHKMVRVILAPRWYPTPRVVELELQKHLATQPDYLEKHDYVRETQPDGSEVYYQKSGKENLLGEVKFQGPNKYNIYLHDTNVRALFARARRASSHGCVRVQDPRELAEYILGHDRGMSAREIREAIEEKEEKIVNLKTPIAVHIDYVSAAVDEEGKLSFGADVYGYDKAFFEGALPVEEAKEFKAASVRGL